MKETVPKEKERVFSCILKPSIHIYAYMQNI